MHRLKEESVHQRERIEKQRENVGVDQVDVLSLTPGVAVAWLLPRRSCFASVLLELKVRFAKTPASRRLQVDSFSASLEQLPPIRGL